MSKLNQLDIDLVKYRKEKLQLYSPYSFLRAISIEKQWDSMILPMLKEFEQKFGQKFDTENSNVYQIITVEFEGKKHQFLVKHLAWDSDFFGMQSYKLITVLYAHHDFDVLAKAVEKFKTAFFEKYKNCCLFTEMPAEDIFLIQALTQNSFRLVESRVNYYKDNISNFEHERYSVTDATEKDIPNLRKVAQEAKNDYDRVHADIRFSEAQAANYLAIYAENAVKGFAETVLIPDQIGVPTDAFLAIGLQKSDAKSLETSFARILLTAALPTCKGWHYKLMAETVQYAKKNNIEYVLMTTQVSNKAVFRNAFKLGFEIGNITHIFAV
jgi:dTDP-4-amino-4,6-dideoxy-D-galactose acyltransferase